MYALYRVRLNALYDTQALKLRVVSPRQDTLNVGSVSLKPLVCVNTRIAENVSDASQLLQHVTTAWSVSPFV